MTPHLSIDDVRLAVATTVLAGLDEGPSDVDVPEGQRAGGPARGVRALPSGRRGGGLITGCPVAGFTGANGVGKTAIAVSACIADMKRGRSVVSTVPIVSRYGSSTPLVSMRQLLDLRDCTLLVDEVSVIFPSRGTSGMPDEVQLFLQTLRHHGVTVRWTAPSWMRADTMLRSVTQVVVSVFAVGKVKRAGSFWPRPLIMGAGVLDTTSVAQDSAPEKVLKRRFYVPQQLLGWGAYDSEADVPRIGRPASGGSCVDCGGSRRRATCSDDRHASLGIPAPFDEDGERASLLASAHDAPTVVDPVHRAELAPALPKPPTPIRTSTGVLGQPASTAVVGIGNRPVARVGVGLDAGL